MDRRHSTITCIVYIHIFRSRSRCSSRSRRRHRSLLLLLLLRACAHADTTTTICPSLSSTADVARFRPSLPSRPSDGFKTPFTIDDKKKSTSHLRLRARFELGRWPSLVFFPCSIALSQKRYRGRTQNNDTREGDTQFAEISRKSGRVMSAFFFVFFRPTHIYPFIVMTLLKIPRVGWILNQKGEKRQKSLFPPGANI